MRIVKKINDIPIRLKFIVIYVAFILVPMIIIYGVFYLRISGEVRLREEVIVDQSLERIDRDVNTLLEGCFNISRDIAIDADINEMLDFKYPSASSYYSMYYEDLGSALHRYQSAYNNVIRVSVYTENDSVFTGGDIYYVGERMEETPWYQAYQKNNNEDTLTGWVEDKKLTAGRNFNRISLMRKMDEISQFSTYEKFLKIDIEVSALEEILDNDRTMDFIIIDQMSNILVASEDMNAYIDDLVLPVFSPMLYDGSNILVEREIYNDGDASWRVIGIMEKSTLSKQIQNYGLLILLLFFLSLGLSVMMILLFSSSYNSRIAVLQSHMVKVQEGDYSVVEMDAGKDEIGFLIRTFNTMTIQLNSLVNQVLKLEIREKEHQLESVKAELKFLQSQMDPHFLFNTLNAILVVCNRKKYTDITEIIKYLSKTLRRLLVWDDAMVTIEDELNFTEMYLKIEKFRFQDKFDYDIAIEEETKAFKLPKMSIQPFVENACKHGIQATKEVGHVTVRVYGTSNKIIIVIKDDGIGMEQHIVDHLFDEENNGSIGMKNVRKRLELNYEDDFDMKVSSQLNVGTTITISLPREVNNAETEEI